MRDFERECLLSAAASSQQSAASSVNTWKIKELNVHIRLSLLFFAFEEEKKKKEIDSCCCVNPVSAFSLSIKIAKKGLKKKNRGKGIQEGCFNNHLVQLVVVDVAVELF